MEVMIGSAAFEQSCPHFSHSVKMCVMSSFSFLLHTRHLSESFSVLYLSCFLICCAFFSLLLLVLFLVVFLYWFYWDKIFRFRILFILCGSGLL